MPTLQYAVDCWLIGVALFKEPFSIAVNDDAHPTTRTKWIRSY